MVCPHNWFCEVLFLRFSVQKLGFWGMIRLLRRGGVWEGKQGSICHFCVCLVLQYFGFQHIQMLGKKHHEKCHCHTPFRVPQILVKTRTRKQCPQMLAGKARPFLPIYRGGGYIFSFSGPKFPLRRRKVPVLRPMMVSLPFPLFYRHFSWFGVVKPRIHHLAFSGPKVAFSDSQITTF